MTLLPRVPAAAIGLMVLLVACAGSHHWENADLPRRQWSKDEAACRRWATAEAEKEAARESAYYDDSQNTRGNTLRMQMAAFDHGKHRSSLLSACMKARGYVDVKGG